MSITRIFAFCSLILGTSSCGQANDRGPIQSTNPGQQSAVEGEQSSSEIKWMYQDFTDWERACKDLPTNRSFSGRLPSTYKTPLTAQEFDKALDAAFVHIKSSHLAETNRWVGAPLDSASFFDTTRVYVEGKGLLFSPFAQKHTVEAGTKLLIHGDFHGDIHSLNGLISEWNKQGILKGFKLSRPATEFLFLGDYTDRGAYGAEVIYTLLRLKMANPDRVQLVRGNHEDLSLTARYGFFAELVGKFGRDYDLRKPLRLYDFLPVVLYLGSNNNFVQCNHGGMEPGFSPIELLKSPQGTAFQLLGELKQKTYLESHPDFLAGLDSRSRQQYSSMLRDFRPNNPVDPVTLGFMWNDFSIVAEQPTLSYNPGRAWVYGQASTQHILKHASTETHRVRAVIRAHQHSSLIDPMMRRLVACRGVHRHWQDRDNAPLLNADPRQLETILESQPKRKLPDGSVFTFNVAPDSSYGVGCNFDFDTYAELDTAEDFSAWTLTVHNLRSNKW